MPDIAEQIAVDTAMVYQREGHWIAHSLRTDQIGVGDRIVDALADLIVANRQVFELAERDETVQPFREAPPKIQRMAVSSKLNDVLAETFKRIEKEFSDRVDAIADHVVMQHGELVIFVKSRERVFSMDLAVDLNALAWDLEARLCELVGPPILPIGFRQDCTTEER